MFFDLIGLKHYFNVTSKYADESLFLSMKRILCRKKDEKTAL
jgi:hypothetical protein